MKRIIAAACASVIALAAFSGCNSAKNMTSTAGEVVTDVVSGAGEAINDIGEGVKSAPDAAESDLNSMGNDGEVSDRDGIINNSDDTQGATYEVEETTENSMP